MHYAMNDLEQLFDRVREIYESERNSDNRSLWEQHARAHWRGTAPKRKCELPIAPFTVEPEPALWRHILDFDIQRYFTDPRTQLEVELRKRVFRFENFHDCTCIGKAIPIWLGVPFETSLLGMDTVYSDTDSPWVGRSPVVKDEADLEKLPEADFYKSGLMPLAHRFYNEIKDMLPDDFDVIFPEWERSVLGPIMHLRGFNNLLIDTSESPDFVHKLVHRVLHERNRFNTQRAKFLKQEIEPGNLLNDEVGSPIISPKIYERFILPSEIELGHFHGGITYWHSCGDTTNFLKLIRRVPGITLFHVSSWTDLASAVEEFGKNGIAIQICVNPVEDLSLATRKDMERKLKEIAQTCGDVAYTVMADGLQKLHSLDAEIEKIKEWIEVAREQLA